MDNYDETEFWITVVHDHLTFMKESLRGKQDKKLEQLLREATSLSNGGDIRNVLDLCKRVKQVKLDLLNKVLVSTNVSTLTPTFISHMINEIDEGISILSCIDEIGSCPQENTALHLHKLWLLDAKGHAITVASLLDPTETSKIKEALKFGEQFDYLFSRCLEFIGFLRAAPKGFPRIKDLNNEADMAMNLFVGLLKELEMNGVLGSLTKLMVNHMIMEEEYYLKKLVKFSS